MTLRDKTFYPLVFEPVLKEYIWGGRGLAKELGRPLPADKDIAESWEIAAHPNGDVTVVNGFLAGKTLSEITELYSRALIGSRGAWALKCDKFPLIVKLLDANRRLSVQVHPNDVYAGANEGNELGKTEMWVVLHAQDAAKVILGVEEGTTPEDFCEALEGGRLETYLHEIPVKAGDFICVPSGSLHAILGGLIIAEIQQNSDVTYRVYDWNRLGYDGKPRPLHIEQAMEVINFEQVEPALPHERLVQENEGIQRWELCRNDYFCVERVQLDKQAWYEDICDGSSLQIWGAIEGKAEVKGDFADVNLEAVGFALLPAELGDYAIHAREKSAMLLRAYLT